MDGPRISIFFIQKFWWYIFMKLTVQWQLQIGKAETDIYCCNDYFKVEQHFRAKLFDTWLNIKVINLAEMTTTICYTNVRICCFSIFN